jgi:hypothetical protein
MSEHDDPIESLLALEREAPGMPDDVSARLAARLGVVVPPSSGGGGGGAPTSSAAPVSQAAGHAGASAWTAARMARLGLVFLLGAASGVVADRLLVAPAEPPAPAPEVVIEPTPIAPPVVVAPPAPPEDDTPTSAVVEPVAPIARPVHAADDGAESSDAERLWLERAEAAFGSGDASAALSALEAHARRFPRGRLSEERDALRVRALYLAGRIDDADQRAERFSAAYPGSVFVRQIARARERAAPAQTHTPVTVP